MEVIDVDIRRVEPAQLFFKRLTEILFVGAVAERELGGEEDFVAEGLDGAADDILRLLVAVVIRRVEIVDAELVAAAEQRDGQRFVDLSVLRGRKAHTAEAERRNAADFSK